MKLEKKDAYYRRSGAGWRWVCGVLLLALAGGPAPAQTAPPLFDDRQIQDVWLDVDPAVWETLRRDYLLDTYYPVQFNWNGQIVANVGIRWRGSGSRSAEKPNLKVAFDKYNSKQQFFGLAAVILKANNQDASLLREVVTMQLYRRMGVPAPREAPARLYINGEFFGAYTLVEALDEAFLLRNFGEDTGYLYDWEETRTAAGYHFEYLGPDPASYSPLMWVPSNHKKDPDPAVIEAMVRAINQSSDAGFAEAVSQYLDLKQFMTYIAVENYAGDFDGILGLNFGMSNFNSYRFAGTTLFQFLPWDKDLAFSWDRHSITDGVDANVLARRAMQVPRLRNAYLEALNKAAELAGGAGGWMEAEVERFYALIGDMARHDPHKQCSDGGEMSSCGAADFEQGVESMRQFARLRAGFVISEVSAAGYRPPAESPRILDAGVTGAALDSGPRLAPGSLVSIYGERLGASTGQASQMPPATTLAGLIVSINGARAPLLYVSPGQVNVQIPWDTTPGPGAFTVFVDGALGNSVTAEIGAFAPGIFLVAHGAGGVPVSPQEPALAGETLIIYATGLGPVDSTQPDRPAIETPTVRVGDVPAIVEFAELTPSFVGLHQVKIQLPDGVPAGTAVPLTLTVGGQTATIPLAIRGATIVN
ncbi:MAG: CotH kinase family protein [Acidobacteria bacterium]|nr:CotH kinase family protein [Acidobacteriota bacterium]